MHKGTTVTVSLETVGRGPKEGCYPTEQVQIRKGIRSTIHLHGLLCYYLDVITGC